MPPIQPILPPQLNTIDLKTAMDRTNYWREAVKGLYNDDMDRIPHGFFIHIEDIKELARLADYYAGSDRTIVGVRAYLTLHEPQADKTPYTNAITALLVPVQEIMMPVEGSNVIAVYDKDLIVPAPDMAGEADPGGNNMTIYDVTMPCPKICDPTSPLF